MDRFHKGYKGSPSSAQFKDIWQSEIKNNPELFKIFIIEYTHDMNSKLQSEAYWQKQFNVVQDPLFINMAYAGKKMIPTKEGVAKALATKKLRNKLAHSEETRKKQQLAAFNRSPISDATRAKMKVAQRNRPPISDETRRKMIESRAKRNLPMSDEVKQKISNSKKGKKVPRDIVEKRAAKIRGRKQSEDCKQKISRAHKGKKHAADHNRKISEAHKGKRYFNNGQNTIRSLEPPGPEWLPGRLCVKDQSGSKNVNATQVRYQDKIYGTIQEAIQQTGLSRYLLLKLGATFHRSPNPSE